MKKYKNTIILIGGATGVTKSSYSYELMKKKIIHKMGSGFIREMAKSFYTKDKLPELYNHSFETNIKYPIRNLYLQSVPLKKWFKKQFIELIEGTSIIFEGVNFIPGLMEFENIDKKILLIVKDKKKNI